MSRFLARLDLRRAAAPAIAVSIGVFLGLGGCDAQSGGASSSGSVENATIGNPSLTFLDRVSSAPRTVAYGGKRHLKFKFSVEGTPTMLEYEEQVWSDGQGRSAIVPGKVHRPKMSTEQLDLFQAMQEARDGFFYRYRDFRIRDLTVFLQNWRVRDTGRQEVVAGVTTSLLEFRRIDGTVPWYRAWIDPVTALVLRAEEIGENGQLASTFEFETFQLAPDTSGLTLQDDQFVRTPFDPASDTVPTLGFQVRPPTVIPAGYRLERSESTSDGTNTWAILTYTDGVDTLFFLQTFDAGGGSPVGEYNVGPKVARGFRFGPWTVLQLRSYSDRVSVIGKADSDAIERMLKSSMH